MSNFPTSITASLPSSSGEFVQLQKQKKNNISEPVNCESIDIEQAIKTVQPTLCPHCFVTDSLHGVISRTEHRWLFSLYYLRFCTWRAIRHPSWVRLSAQTHTLAGRLLSVVIFKCQVVKRITVSQKHVEQNGFGGFHILIQQLSQKFSNVRKNNIDF